MAFEYRIRSNEQWEQRANQSGSNFEHYIKDEYRLYTPATNENHIRILPPSSLWKDAPHWGLDCWVHFSVGPDKGSVICLDRGAPQLPGRSGHACPICEARHEFERSRDEDMLRLLRPVKRVVTAVIDRKDEPKGVLIWGCPYTLDQQIIKASRDRTTGGWFLIDRPADGYDIYFDRDGSQINTKYTGVQLARKPSPVADKWIEWVDQNPIPEVLKWRTYDEIKKIYGGGGGGRGDDGPSGGDRPPRWPRDDDNGPRGFEAQPERPAERAERAEPQQPQQQHAERPSNGADRGPSSEAEPAKPSSDAKTRADELAEQLRAQWADDRK